MTNIIKSGLTLLLIMCVIGCEETDKVTPPVAPSNLIATVSSTTQINLTWTDNSTTEDGFKVERKTASTNYQEIANVSKDITIYNDIGLTNNVTYTYRVYSYNSAGKSATYTNEASATTLGMPTIATANVTQITTVAASSGGTITNDGGSSITARGVVWNTSSAPTINLSTKTSNGVGVSAFTSNITSLTPGTMYFVRAYATNTTGTSYGNEISFSTLPLTAPQLTTTDASLITSTTASSGGTVTNDGGSPITARGICWDTSQNPTTSNSKTIETGTTGSYSSSLKNLNETTTYYARAYATNAIGTSYGQQITFTTRALQIGDDYGGGKIAYFFVAGDPGYVFGQKHGLIVAPSDQSQNTTWCNGCDMNNTPYLGTTSTALGSGNDNTNKIVASLGSGTYAAKLCYDLVLNGFSDWYLPSKDELNKLCLNKDAVGMKDQVGYFSSSESTYTAMAWTSFFLDCSQNLQFKYGVNWVRAMRSF